MAAWIGHLMLLHAYLKMHYDEYQWLAGILKKNKRFSVLNNESHAVSELSLVVLLCSTYLKAAPHDALFCIGSAHKLLTDATRGLPWDVEGTVGKVYRLGTARRQQGLHEVQAKSLNRSRTSLVRYFDRITDWLKGITRRFNLSKRNTQI